MELALYKLSKEIVEIIQSSQHLALIFHLTLPYLGGFLGGQENFQKHVMNLEWYTPTFWKFVLMSSFKIGIAKELPARDGSSSYIPFYDRFIMGGNGIHMVIH